MFILLLTTVLQNVLLLLLLFLLYMARWLSGSLKAGALIESIISDLPCFGLSAIMSTLLDSAVTAEIVVASLSHRIA